MRILQITNSFFPVIGGQEKVVLELSKGLAKRGHKVTVLTTDYLCKGKVKSEEEKFGFKIVRFKNDYWFAGYGYSRGAMRWLKENYRNFDVVHCHGYNRYLAEFSLRFLGNKKPTIFSPLGFVHTKKNLFFKKVHDLTIGKFIKKATYATALSKSEFEYYKKLGVKKKKIFEIPGGVNLDDFSKKNEKRLNVFREKYSIKGDFILSVGRLHESKGFQYLIKAIKGLEINLVIIGKDAGFKKELERIAKDQGLQEKVKILDGISDEEKVDAYNSCFAFVLFSEWEGFGIVVIEAMAAGKPVIVSDRGSLPFLVTDGENGLIATFPSVEELTKKLKELLKNDKLRLKLARISKKFSRAFSWGNIVRKTEKLYKKALEDEK